MKVRTFAAGVVAALLLLTTPLTAQIYNVPTPAPSVSAADRDWFVERRPIFFAGDYYYPAGARYHFDANVMVETGTFDGVPLYADTSAEPYGQILVPIGGGLVQPYERRRAGSLAGTSGSHAPGFPTEVVPWEDARQPRPEPWRGRRASAPVEAPEDQRVYTRQEDEEARLRLLEPPGRIQTILAPDDNRGIWIVYEGTRWSISGPAVAYDRQRFSQIGNYRGFPVLAARGGDEIYLPGVEGMLAVYRKDTAK